MNFEQKYSPIANQSMPKFPTLASTTQAEANSALQKALQNPTGPPCCPNPTACQETAWWQAAFKGCPYSYADNSNIRCEVAPLGDRYWVTDLNPLWYERNIMHQAEQNWYDYMNARQMLQQFLMVDVRPRHDPYCKELQSIDQSFCIQQRANGPPQYTTF